MIDCGMGTVPVVRGGRRGVHVGRCAAGGDNGQECPFYGWLSPLEWYNRRLDWNDPA